MNLTVSTFVTYSNVNMIPKIDKRCYFLTTSNTNKYSSPDIIDNYIFFLDSLYVRSISKLFEKVRVQLILKKPQGILFHMYSYEIQKETHHFIIESNSYWQYVHFGYWTLISDPKPNKLQCTCIVKKKMRCLSITPKPRWSQKESCKTH